MQILDILTRPIGTNEQSKIINLIIMTALWIFMVIIITVLSLKTDGVKVVAPLLILLSVQLVVCNSYAECRIAIVKKELLKEQQEIKFTLKAMEQAKKLDSE